MGEGARHESHHLEEALTADASLRQALFEGLDLPMALVSRDHRVVMANRAMADLLGSTPEALRGGPCLRSRGGDTRHDPGERTLRTGQPDERLLTVPGPDGSHVVLLVRTFPMRPDSGIDGYLAVAREVSEELRREKQQRLLGAMMANTEHLAVLKDPRRRYLTANPAFARMLGLDSDEVLGKRDEDLLNGVATDSDLSVYAENDRRALELPAGESLTVEEHLSGGKTRRVFLSKKFPVYDEGALLGVATVSQEITQLKRTEEELRRVNQQLRAMFANIPGHLNVVDADYRIINVSRGLMEAFGLPDDADILGRHCFEILQNRRTVCGHCSLPKAMEEKRLVTRFSTPEEDERTGRSFKMYCAPILDEDDRVIGGMEYVADVTDLRQLTRALEEAKERAEAASRAKSAFLATISHEIRTPLNAVLGMLQILDQADLAPEHAESVRTALMAGRGLAGLLNDLLDLSRVEAGRMEIAAEPLRPGDVLRQTAEALQQQATDKGLAISVEVEDGAPEWLDGDEQRLRQILFNLAGNAIKFTERGRVALRLRPDGERLLFEVEDTGVGISRGQIHRLFESFTQIDDSTTRRHQGTGLGLAIVKNLVELMGGEVWVESEPGEGSAFRFTLPLRPTQDGNPGGPAPRSGTAEEASAPAKRVLVVEDNEINRMVARRLLDKLGHECRVAGDGAGALDMLAEQPFDLVLMDIQMPDMDGLETVRRLRAGKAGEVNRRTPVAALTAHAGSGDRERAREAGIDGYLPKPLDLNELDSEVRRLTGDE